jgi:hypothetical protein
MPTIRLSDLSKDEAENLIKQVWCILEEYQIASPEITVERRLELYLKFRSKDVDTVKRALSLNHILGYIGGTSAGMRPRASRKPRRF